MLKLLLVTVGVLALGVGTSDAGSISKAFNDAANPPLTPKFNEAANQKSLTQTFNDSRGKPFVPNYPAPHLTPNGLPGPYNGTSSVAVPLNPPFTSVGKLE